MIMMEKFQSAVEKWLLPIAGRFSTNRVLRAISTGFSSLLPIIITGAFASLLSGLNIDAYQNFITSTGLKPVIALVTNYTTNMIALYASFSIAKAMADQLDCRSQSVLAGLISLFMFLLVIPVGVTAGDMTVDGVISTQYFGAAGLFTAMILGITVPYIYNFFIVKNIVIRMPDGVPPQIANGFSAIIPTIFMTVLFVVIRQLCALTSFETLNGLIYGILKVPLSHLAQSPFTFLLLLLFCNVLWFFGIHGGMVTNSFLSMLYLQPAMENLEALAAGEPLPNLLTNTWWFVQAQMGGSGGIIGLAVIMLILSKSERYKNLGRLSILPALCSISEPVVFGMPLVLNAVMFIPMILSPVCCFGLSYLFTSIGILPYLNGIQLSTGTPVILSGFLAGGWATALWQMVLIAVQALIYLPFFRVMDRQALEEEK